MRRKIVLLLFIAALIIPVISSCTDSDYPGRHFHHGETAVQMNNAVAEVIREGRLKDMMPPTSVMIAGVMVPITAIAGFFVFLIIFAKLSHRRSMAMIEKGLYQPSKIRWDLITLFIGLITAFTGLGVSLTTAAYFGPQPWTILSGVIPLLIGIAFLVFYGICQKNK